MFFFSKSHCRTLSLRITWRLLFSEIGWFNFSENCRVSFFWNLRKQNYCLQGDGNNTILHRMGEYSVIDRGQFDDEKSRYWQDRFKMFSDAELKKIYGWLPLQKLLIFNNKRILTMALYRVRTKRRKCRNGVNIEPGMEVQVVTPLNNTVQVNNWQYVEDAFMRVFGISLRKANCLNISDLEITKL